MSILERETTILVVCAPGLSELLAGEVRQLGYDVTAVRPKGVEITGTMADAIRLNLHVRTGLYVLFLLREFECTTPDQLYRQVAKVRWDEIIDPDEYVSVVSRVDTASIDNSMFPSMKVKDAIVDTIMQRVGRRPDSGPDRNNVVVNVYWKDRRCWLYLNTTGNKLSDRNYRKIPGKAPLQETLAAGIVLSTGYDGRVPLALPMCGSGTLAIEAALIGMGRQAGALRTNLSFMHVKGYDGELWKRLRRDGRKVACKGLGAPIIATDIDDRAIEAARKNAMTAGVDQLIEFSVCDFADTLVPRGPGIVVLNPEYGERMGDCDELVGTYKRIGDWFKQSCAGYTGYVFTGNLALAKKIGLRTSRRTGFYNGSIECRVLKYEMYDGSRKGTGASEK